jgi:hypothetical protein
VTKNNEKFIEKNFLFLNNLDMKDIEEKFNKLKNNNDWKHIWGTHLKGSFKKVSDIECTILLNTLKKRNLTLLKYMKNSDLINIEEEKYKNVLEDYKKSLSIYKFDENKKKINDKMKMIEFDKLSTYNWKKLMSNISDERGPWGEYPSLKKIYWKLDTTENKRGMRLLLKRDYNPIDHKNAEYSRDKRNNVTTNNDESTSDVDNINQSLLIKGNSSILIPKLIYIKEGDIKDEKDENIKKGIIFN